ncbi:MAG: hypothetical protein Q4D85_10970 [Corynebacterium sp.]|uniref:hypothetical protein n=1 Tax=Corynebacterium sp. TaxID=1720 RepID=UPI0026DB4385|nr:hypothetical protein [Corynebacterium sp.]MDO5099257.1 hypothetical protein [Corynebacterium sp.]
MIISTSDAVAGLRLWGLTDTPIREHSGRNKHTWKVGDTHWLTADSAAVSDLWFTVDELLRQKELMHFQLQVLFLQPVVVSRRVSGDASGV